jgi:hypothetical protein
MFSHLQPEILATSGTLRGKSALLLRLKKPPEENAMRHLLMAGAISLGLAIPAAAQTTEFYIVQDTATKRCTIVDKKPTTTTSVVVGDGAVFKTRTEAETGMKKIKVCTTN